MGKARKGNTDNTPVPNEPSEVSKEALRESRRLASAARREEKAKEEKQFKEEIDSLFYTSNDFFFYVTFEGKEFPISAENAREAVEKVARTARIKSDIQYTATVKINRWGGREYTQDYTVQKSKVGFYSPDGDTQHDEYFVYERDLCKYKLSGSLELEGEFMGNTLYTSMREALKDHLAGLTFALGEEFHYVVTNTRTKETDKGTLAVELIHR